MTVYEHCVKLFISMIQRCNSFFLICLTLLNVRIFSKKKKIITKCSTQMKIYVENKIYTNGSISWRMFSQRSKSSVLESVRHVLHDPVSQNIFGLLLWQQLFFFCFLQAMLLRIKNICVLNAPLLLIICSVIHSKLYMYNRFLYSIRSPF